MTDDQQDDPFFTDVVISNDGDEWNDFVLEDVDLSLETTTDNARVFEHPHEIEFSFEAVFEIEGDVTTCPHCGAANTIPDPSWLFFLDTDPNCGECGFPLGVVR